MAKKLVEDYSFDASEKQVTLTKYNPIVIERLLMITNITDNIIIFVFNNSAKGGTASTNVITLTYDTTSMSDTDKLQIFYDDVPATGTTTSVASSAFVASVACIAGQYTCVSSDNSSHRTTAAAAAATTSAQRQQQCACVGCSAVSSVG